MQGLVTEKTDSHVLPCRSACGGFCVSTSRTAVHPAGTPSAPGGSPGRRPFLPVEPPSSSSKAYVVVRSDLSAGAQMVQVAHAMAAFPHHDPAAFDAWRRDSDSLVVLSVSSEQELLDLLDRARARGVSFSSWREPDYADELVSASFPPSPATSSLLVGLPLAGRSSPPSKAASRESALRRLFESMSACEQTPGMTVFEHGRAVRETYNSILDFASGAADPSSEEGWSLPSWVISRGPELIAAQVPLAIAQRYLTLHDCGKPDVRVVAKDGKTHFPGHAQASVRRYLRTLGRDADPVVAELIGSDMLVHTGSAEDMKVLARRQVSATLLLAAVAETHANAAMFGGVSSTSFKAKIRRVDQRGRALIREWDASAWPSPSKPVSVKELLLG